MKMKKSTDFTPSKKFLATLEHLSPLKREKAIDRWQLRQLETYKIDIDKNLVNDGINTGSFYAELMHSMGRL
jgi:hypothetical protein